MALLLLDLSQEVYLLFGYVLGHFILQDYKLLICAEYQNFQLLPLSVMFHGQFMLVTKIYAVKPPYQFYCYPKSIFEFLLDLQQGLLSCSSLLKFRLENFQSNFIFLLIFFLISTFSNIFDLLHPIGPYSIFCILETFSPSSSIYSEVSLGINLVFLQPSFKLGNLIDFLDLISAIFGDSESFRQGCSAMEGYDLYLCIFMSMLQIILFLAYQLTNYNNQSSQSVNFVVLQVLGIRRRVFVSDNLLRSFYKVWVQKSLQVRGMLSDEPLFFCFHYFNSPQLDKSLGFNFPLLLLLCLAVLLYFNLPKLFHLLDMLFELLAFFLQSQLINSLLFSQSLQHFDSKILLQVFLFLLLLQLQLHLLLQSHLQQVPESLFLLLLLLQLLLMLSLTFKLEVLYPNFFKSLLLLLSFEFDDSHFFIYGISLFFPTLLLQLLLLATTIKTCLVLSYLLQLLLISLFLLNSDLLFDPELLEHVLILLSLLLLLLYPELLLMSHQLLHFSIHCLLLLQVLTVGLQLKLLASFHLIGQVLPVLLQLLLVFPLLLCSNLFLNVRPSQHLLLHL